MAVRGMNAGSVFGTVYILLFAIIWICITLTIPVYPMNIAFASFGVLIFAAGIYNIYHMIKGRSIVDSSAANEDKCADDRDYSGYCPYCGSPVERNHDFCSVCGKKI